MALVGIAAGGALLVPTVLLLLALLGGEGVRAYPDTLIRCKVCERAITHVWHKAEELRQICRSDELDTRCDYHHPDPKVIDKMAWGVCEALPTTYHALHESEFFDLVDRDGTPEHTAEAARAIKNSCIRWLHTQHGAEEVSKVVMANIEAGKTAETILKGIRRRFCQKACGYKSVSARVSHHHPVHDEM